jgi:uncharacterized membrane protein
MSIRTVTIVLILIVLGSLAFSLWAAPRLPDSVPSHWNAAGEVDGYSSRTESLFLIPAITLGVGLLLIFIPMIDPLRANVDKFRRTYHWAVLGFAVYFTYLHVLILLAGLGVNFNMTTALIPAFGLLFIGLGFLLERTQPNWFIGIRTPWTLSSPVVWEKTHKIGGKLFKLGGLVALVGIFFPMEIGFIIMMSAIMVPALGTVMYSYIAFRQEKKTG